MLSFMSDWVGIIAEKLFNAELIERGAAAVSHGAHIGGQAGGFVMAYLLK